MLYTNAYVERSIKFFVKEDNIETFDKVRRAIEKFKKENEKNIKLGQGSVGKTPKVPKPENR